MKNILLLGSALLLVCGCVSSKTPPKEKAPVLENFNKENEQRALAVASAFASGFEKSLISGEFSHFAQVFPANSKSKMSEEHFKKLREAMMKLYGKPEKLHYITFLNQGKLRDYLWKITFTSPGKNGAAAPGVREILLSVRIYCENGNAAVSGFFFQRF
ncbi:MAG: hypothetical protein IKC89_02630 [Lentisphaeria bacterium]|nr:hypothetical protein [Lentisphaeria bacterium]